MRITDSSLLNGLGALSDVLGTSGQSKAQDTDALVEFKDILAESLEKSEQISGENAAEALALLTGNTDDIASTLISAQKAELAMSLTVAVRNKALDAYKEIMNMQV
ncbi:MAG TPA: flagellar hook-basal body complex protein FliE [Papillibacter sp.]|jgi:flagellar hook-basal body complex protein FliE|nr:flagellar hook-basal body complex protein FliE [Papillibacter sp.]